MRWTVEYKVEERGAWTKTGVECKTSEDAWNYLTFLRKSSGIDYHTAQVRPA